MTTAELTRELTTRHVSYELIAHRHTERATDEAAAIGVRPDEVAKTIVLTSDAGFVRAVLPASERLDLHKVREHLGGGKEIRFATEEELVGAYPAFELGAVPPFGGPPGDRVLVDRRIAEHELIVLEAGTHEESVRMTTADLLALTKADVADICLGRPARS
jgi:Ala-tRNA(Pro) deacylase